MSFFPRIFLIKYLWCFVRMIPYAFRRRKLGENTGCGFGLQHFTLFFAQNGFGGLSKGDCAGLRSFAHQFSQKSAIVT